MLPAAEKMKPAGYRDIQAGEIPVVMLPGGARVRVIAGTLDVNGAITPGPIQGLATDPLYLDIELPAGATLTHPIKPGYNAFVYPFEGSAAVGPAGKRYIDRKHCSAGNGCWISPNSYNCFTNVSQRWAVIVPSPAWEVFSV